MRHMRYSKAWCESLLAAAVFLMPLACGHGTPTSATPPSSTPPVSSSVDPLREAAVAAGKLVGAAVQSSFLADVRYTSVFNRHFNYVTAEYEMKWDPIERAGRQQTLPAATRSSATPPASGMQVKGHALVWHGARARLGERLSSTPSSGRRSRATSQRVAGHYRGRVSPGTS